jgi:hypothetical protein
MRFNFLLMVRLATIRKFAFDDRERSVRPLGAEHCVFAGATP